MLSIDLNCDLGEGFPDDERLIPLVSSVNVACGGHAGDDATMRNAVCLACRCGVNIGAHPGYEDRDGFGRFERSWPVAEISASFARQLRRLTDITSAEGATLGHVKPHGALYHRASHNAELAAALIESITSLCPLAAVVTPPRSELAVAAQRAGLTAIGEGFADRRYLPDGSLAPRGTTGAVIKDESEAAVQAVRMIRDGLVHSVDGSAVRLRVQTLCVHGDGAHAVALLTFLRAYLANEGIEVRPFNTA
ncbi:MAG TPA: 5-oxoprolinase subunit PxpA [Tepidisphaeraceae bacterium]|jgi:UPF0271 protein